jgi:dolichol-phosphate mannosyltransferase
VRLHSSKAEPRALSVVIPTLDEAQNIDAVIRAVLESCADRFDIEIIVVDDGSADGTRDLVRAWEGQHPVKLLARDRQGGLAGAVLAGAAAAGCETIVVMDADLSHPPDKIPLLAGPILDGSSDMVIGSRYVAGGATPDWPRKRRFASRLASCLAWPLVDAHDPMSGFFAVGRKRLMEVGSEADGFKIGFEVLVRGGEALRVKEVPIHFHDRSYGESKFGSKQVYSYLRRLWVLAGAALPGGNSLRFGLTALVGMAVDLVGFFILFLLGAGFDVAQMGSFAAAALVVYSLDVRWCFGGTTVTPRLDWLRFLLVCLMAFFLRGAVLTLLVAGLGWPPTVAILAAVVAAVVVNYLGGAFYVRPSQRWAEPPAASWRIAAIAIIAYLLVIRLLYLGQAELLVEEAYYWNYAQHPDLSYLDHPPMVAWLIRAGTSIFGQTEFGVRIGAILCWCVTATFCFITARNLFGKSAGFRAALLSTFLPVFFIFGFFITPDSPLIACWAGMICFLERALLGDRRRVWWGVGICLGLGMLSKYTIALLGPAILLFVVLDPRSRKWLLRPEPYLAILVAVLLFTPVILWNAENQWASFVFQGTRRLEHVAEFKLHNLVGALLILLTPFGLIGAVRVLLPVRLGGPGLVDEAALASRRRLFAAVMALVPLAVFAAFSVRHAPKLNWAGPLWLAVLPLLGWDLVAGMQNGSSTPARFIRRAMWTTMIVTSVGYGAALYHVTAGVPGVPYVRMYCVGWRDLGRQIEQIEDKLELQLGYEPLVVGMDKYNISSQLAFYRNRVELDFDEKQEGHLQTAGRNLFSRSSLMYARWFPAESQRGRTLILVSDEADDLANQRVTSYFDSLEPVEKLVLKRNGKIVREYFYRICRGYKGLAATVTSIDAARPRPVVGSANGS